MAHVSRLSFDANKKKSLSMTPGLYEIALRLTLSVAYDRKKNMQEKIIVECTPGPWIHQRHTLAGG
jgi:hypothetical protein